MQSSLQVKETAGVGRDTRSGVELFGLVFHDEAKVSALLEDLVGFEPVRGRRKGSATARVKVKYKSGLSVADPRRRTNSYVTLPCADETYGQGVSLWHHRQLQQWAAQKGEEFSTQADRLRVRANMVSKLEELAPTLKGKERRALARLQNSPKVQSLGGGEVALAYAPCSHGPSRLRAQREGVGQPQGPFRARWSWTSSFGSSRSTPP
jgi:putative transposase